MTDAVDKAAKYNEELGWLISQWQPLMTEEQLTNAINAYKAQNPEYVEALNKIDKASVNAIRALTAFQRPETNFAGLGHADDVNGALNHLFGDKKAQLGIAQSQKVTEEIALLLDRAESDTSAKNVLDGIISAAGAIDDGDFLTETVFNKIFDATIDRSVSAAKARNIDAVTTQIQRLEKYADKLGYSSRELNQVFRELEKVSQATGETDVKVALRRLTNKLEILEQTNPELLGEGNRFADKFKRFGLLLGAVGTGASLYQAIDDPNAMSIAQALVDSAGLTNDILQTKIVTSLLKNEPWFSRLPLQTAGRALGGLSLVLDAISIAQDIRDGNYVEAGFSSISAAGGALAIFGTTAAATGIGLVLVGGALIGSLIYGSIKEANKYETDGARAFLRGAGVNHDVANELINNDNDGRSAAPVFTELAKRLGISPQRFFEYLKTLSPSDANRLIQTAHGIDPDENGQYPDHKPDITRAYPTGTVTLSAPNDIYDLIKWMRENGFANAPGL